MRHLDCINSYKSLKNEITYFNEENSQSHGENVNIIIVTKKRLKNRKKHDVFIQAQQHRVFSRLSRFGRSKEQVSITRHSSMPELNKCTWPTPPRNRSGRGKDTIQNKYKQSPFRSKFIVNVVSEHRFDERLNPFSYPRQTILKIYRCEVGATEDNCCCSCNSDAMFEIMKCLYDCYKKRDCTNCCCILCSHLKPEDKLKFSEKEKLLREQAMKGLPLPEGKTSSEIKLINKVRTDLGVPIEPKTKEIRDKHEEASKAGKLLPLEGKTSAEKEKILQDLFDMGIPLPKGRTPSEKALIAKISGKAPSDVLSVAITPSEQMRKAKAEGLLTPLKGKTPEDREKILKGLAMIGLPLPEGQTPSENILIDKVRTDLGLPIEPKTKDIRDKHEKAAKAGKLLPLEGKTPEQKEKILKGLHDMGIPLPVGRTPSEKSLIAKIAASPRGLSKASSAALAPSEQMRRAKAEGLLTPLKGKTPKQREKILRGLAMKGIPLPEAQSPSEKKLIKKVRTDLGVPIEPKTKAIRKKHEEAAKAGKLLPLEGKKPEKKKKILEDLHDMGIPLPVGRTPSEKALIAEVKSKKPTEAVSVVLAPSELMRRAKEEGLLTPLKGKTPEQKEKIVKGLAMKGLPLPEAQSPSEKKLIDKIRTDLGLPKDPTTKSMKDKHEKAAKAGLLQPLEGKTPKQKEKTLKGLRDLGIPLPEGRTPSEKALIEKVKASPPSVIAPSEQLRRAKVEGLLTPLKGKSPEQKEKIVKGLAMKGLPLPEAESPSEKKLIDKVRADLGLPKDPTTKSMKDRHEQAAKAGLLQPLEGKTPAQKEKVLKGLRDLGIPLPEGRTPSEKDLIDKVKASPRSVIAPSEQLRRAKAEGLLTPLKGKTPEQKEKILKGLAMKGLALPEAQSPSEKKLIDKVRADLGLPKDPTTKSMKDKHEQAAKAGLLQPLEGKTPSEKAKVLKGLRDLGIPLPEGRTPSEKALIGKVKESPRSVIAPSEQLRRAKAEGLLTPLKGKPPEQKEKILKGLAMKGLSLPEAQSPSEKKLIDKVRADLGLPKDPTTKSMKEKHEQAAKAGLLQPLEGKTPAEKAKVLKGLRDLGIPLPEGRTPSEKALIDKVKASSRSIIAVSEQLRRAKAEGLLTALKGKPPEQKEKIVKGLAMKGLPLPEAQSPSEKKLIDKVRADLGLPKDPTTKSMKEKHEQAAKAGLLQPLEGKTPAEKAKVLKGLRDLGIPLPEGRTPSEKALIDKVKASPRSVIAPSEQLRRAKAEGLLTPLKGKPPEQKEKILKGLAMKGLALPEAQSLSEQKLIDKVRADLGLPKDPTTKSMKEKHEQAAKAGLLQPLEGKTPAEKAKVLKGLRDLGIPLPEGRTPSEKALIDKVKASSRSVIAASEQLRRAKAEGLLTPLKGKPPEQKEKILKGLAMKGLALPEAQSLSEQKLIDKVRADLGLPKDPTTKSMKEKHEQAAKAGLLQPLEGKTPAQKEKVLKGLRDLGIPLPEGRTPSEKALIGKVKASPRSVIAPSEQLRRAKAEGLLTALKGKPPEQKEKIVKGLAMKGLPLPEAQSPSEKKLIDKVRADLGLPKDPTTKSMKEKHEQAAKAGLLQPLEGKTPAEKVKVLKGLRDLGIPLPEGRTPSEKALIDKVKASSRSVIAASEQLRRAQAEGLLTPLKGKPPEQKEKILKGLAMKGLALPEAQSPSEKKLIDKVRADLGLPKDPTTKSMKEKHEQAAKAGKLLPLEGKTTAEKAKVLRGLRDLGIPLPEGRTPSEKALIAKIKASSRSILALSEQLRRAKAEGLLTPLKGKTPEEREKILRGLAMKGLPLPEGQTPSQNKLINKVRTDLGLPIEPKTKDIRDKHEKAAKAGKLLPLEGKTPAQKEKILKGLHNMGIPLPIGRTPSEKSLIAKVAASPRSPSKAASATLSPSEQLRTAKAEGLLTTLKSKTPEEREKILRGLAMKGLPLPEGQTPSENKLIDKVRTELGLPIEPKTKAIRDKHEKAAKAGKLLPLEGKTPTQKEKILKGLHNMGIPLPIGRTPSEKSLIAKIAASSRGPSKVASAILSPSEQLRAAKAEGLLTPFEGKTPEEKEKILRGLAMKGLPLPEGQTPSENKLIDKVRTDLGLPIEPKTKAIRDKHEKAAKAGKLLPLEGKTPAQKEKILKGLHNMGIPLPIGRTPSEKSLIAKIAASPRGPSKAATATLSPSEQLRAAKAEGLLTPLEGKTPEEKEKILRGLAMKGLPLPEGQTPSENKLIDKVRTDLGLPVEPKTKAIRDKHEKAAKSGKLLPLEGKTPTQKEKILKGLHNMGIPLPMGRTPSEKSLIAKIAASPRGPSKAATATLSPSEQLRAAKAEGLLTPLEGKTPEEKEKILRGLAMKGLPLPEGQTPSENELIDKVRTDLGLPIEPKTKAIRDKHEKAAKAGKLLPLEGKTPAQKEKILKGLHNMSIPLPIGRTPSEKSLIAKIAASPRGPSKAATATLSPSEQLRAAKAEGLLTPLEGKTPEEKEKILRGLAMKGLPLPEGQTPSENKLIDKVRTDLGLPIEPKTKAIRDKHEKAAKSGKLLPLEGKTPAQKEKILKGLHNMGIPLPIGRTPSEKSLIAKIAASPRGPSKAATPTLSPSEQLRAAKAEGLLTPLEGKTPEEKEKILRGLAMKGLPLPEGQTPSENKLIGKVRTDLGLPIEPKTKAIRDKHEKAAKAGKLLPLEGKTPAQKEKILKGLHNMGIPLPIGRTPSEKSLIAKIAASRRGPSKAATETLSPSEQLRAAKAEGLLTPLEGKTPEEKEKILRGLAMKGLPLPEGQTPSENKLIGKVRTDLGLPIEPKTKAIRDKHEQAAKAGKLLPLEGKTPEQKEKILRGLHDMGIPLPIGRTASEKALIAKVMAGPAAAIGVSASKKAAGIAAEYEEIEKTTKCDRACGCDKKKIRFKHSYVKIRVTSPDISSFCDCPDICIPGVKSGVFIDSDGIKVTIASALGIPSFTAGYKRHITLEEKNYSHTHSEHKRPKKSISSKYKVSSFKPNFESNRVSYILSSSSYFESSSTRPNSTESDNIYLQSSTPILPSKLERTVKRCLQPLGDGGNKNLTPKTKSTASSLGSILVLKSEMSLCSTISNKIMNTVSSISGMNSSITSTSTHYSSYQSTDDPRSSSSLDELSTSDDLIDHPATFGERKKFWNIGATIPKREYTILRVSQTRIDFGNSEVRTNVLNSEEDPILLMNHSPSKLDVSKLIDKILSKKRFADASSIFIVVPMSEDEEEQASSCVDSMTSIQSSETETILKDTSQVDPNLALRPHSFTKRDVEICRKGKKFYMKEISSSDTETMYQNESVQALRPIEMTKQESCQISRPNEIEELLEKAVHDIGTDTTKNIPCCCCPKEYPKHFVVQNCSSNEHYKANVLSQQKKSLSSQGKTSGCCLLVDMRTPSLEPSPDLRATCEVLTQTSSGFRPIAHKATSCSHVPDMRSPAPSSMPLVQPSDKPGAVGSSEKSGCCCLPDMRTPSLMSLVQLRDSSSALKSRIFPSKTPGCARLPDMRKPSAGSSGLPGAAPSQPSVGSSHFPHKTTGYHQLPGMSSAVSSILQSKVPSEVPCSSGVDWSSLSLSETFGCCCSPASTEPSELLSDIATCSDSHLSLDDSWLLPARLRHNMHYSKMETTVPQRNRRELPSHTIKRRLSASSNKLKITCKIDPDEMTYPIAFENPTHTGPIPRRDSPDEDDCLCKDIEGTDIISDQISGREPRLQESRNSEMPIYSSDEDDCLCEEIEGTDKMPSQEPQLQPSGKSKILINPVDGDHCLCEDLEATNERSTQQPRFQVRQKSKKLKVSIKEDFENIDVERPGLRADELRNRHPPPQVNWKSIKLKNSTVKEDPEIQQQLKNLTIEGCECKQQSKDSITKVNCECLRQYKDFAIKANCECQQQSKVLASKGFCACEETAARNRLFITGQGQHQDRASTIGSKITKFITRIRKSISHKIDKTMKGESKKNMETEKKSVKPQSSHSIQTTHEQVLHSQQIPPTAPSELEVVNDGYPYEYSCGWIDIEKLMRLRSELTETTSGFKACKKKNQRVRTEATILEKPNAGIELDFEDAIKYYVGKNLEQFQDLIPPIQSLQKTAQEANKKAEKKRKDSFEEYKNIDNFFTSKDCCGCPYGPVPLEISYKSITLTPEASAELKKMYPKGLKFSLGGIGLQPALGGPGSSRKPDRTGAGA